MRWSPDLVSKINITPLTFRSGALDKIEESAEYHAHVEPGTDVPDAPRQLRRLRLMDKDVRRF